MPKRQRIYVDTSVIGGCCDDEFREWSTALMADFRVGSYLPVISTIVQAEIADAPAEVLEKYEDLLDCEPEVLDLTADADALAGEYVARKILTERFHSDALHIALATLGAVDMLVSWNFRHIVHFQKIRLFHATNVALGYKPVEIYSPREVASHGDQDR